LWELQKSIKLLKELTKLGSLKLTTSGQSQKGNTFNTTCQFVRVDDMNCCVCDRKDEIINMNLNKMMDNERYIPNAPKSKLRKSSGGN